MSSQRRKDASRANGARSYGPVTPEGLARCRNAPITHGLTAGTTVVLQTESKDDFNALRDAYLAHFQPATVVEHTFVLQLVTAQWRMNRAAALEGALLDLEMARQEPRIEKEFEVCANETRAALAFQALCDESRVLTTLNRYEARHTRTFHRALKALENRPVHKGPSSENGHPDPPPLSGPVTSRPSPASPPPASPAPVPAPPLKPSAVLNFPAPLLLHTAPPNHPVAVSEPRAQVSEVRSRSHSHRRPPTSPKPRLSPKRPIRLGRRNRVPPEPCNGGQHARSHLLY
jgi:hypothetical protein